MGNFATRVGFEWDVEGLSPSADAGVIRAPERELHQGKNGVNESLRAALRKTRLGVSTVEIVSSE